MTATHHRVDADHDVGFDRILCVTEHSPAGAQAVKHATVLARAGGALEIVSVAPSPPPGAPRPQAEQIESLVAARLIAREAGVQVDTHIVESPDAAAGVLERCADRDLLVVPAGETALRVLTEAPLPVLVARPAPDGTTFTESVLVAVDGSPAAHHAARVGAHLAVVHGSLVALVATPERDATHRHSLQDDVAVVASIAGLSPLVLDEQSAAVPAILGSARAVGATLIVLGSRPGNPADSVSAAVARRAGCSVLVLRPGLPVTPPRG